MSDPSEMRATRRSSRGAAALVLLALAVLAAAVLWRLPFGDPDQRHIDSERYWRRARTAMKLPLAGTPDLARLDERLTAKGLKAGAPVFMRIFKHEFELELWLARDGRFEHFATYPICRFSGGLGPKFRQGDRQAPEGVYTVDARALNPASRWHRSFNLGFPNTFDRAHGRTGSALMVHGGCSSVGCYAMTDAVIDEVWRLVTAAFAGGQKRFQVQALPFRMSEENLAARTEHPAAGLWRDLKAGYDLFEAQRVPPRVGVCQGRYTFSAADRPADGSAPIGNSCAHKGVAGAG